MKPCRSILPAILVALSAPVMARAQPTCRGNAELVGSLGIEIACDCTVSADATASPWNFRSAIKVAAVRPRGPADGVLRTGDQIVTIDGLNVRTPEGARRLAALRQGERVRLGVQRGAEVLQLNVTTSGICPDDMFAIGRYTPAVVSDSAAVAAATGVAPVARGYGGRGAVGGRGAIGGRGQTPPPPAATGAATSGDPMPVPIIPDLEPAGFLGFALACRQCGWAREPGASPYWESSTEPVVYSIASASPAERAGLRINDKLTHVNGDAITTARGGRALGAVVPGDSLKIRVTRDGAAREVVLIATVRPMNRVPRYRGNVSGVTVEVDGGDAVRVVEEGTSGGLLIIVGTTVIRLRPARSF